VVLIGSDAVLLQIATRDGHPVADQSGLKKIDLAATVHLTLHDLKARDLPLGLAVRPALNVLAQLSSSNAQTISHACRTLRSLFDAQGDKHGATIIANFCRSLV